MSIKVYYVVLSRFGVNNTQYVSLIMILDSQPKAEALAKFLNDGSYFESKVTVEGYAAGSYEEVKSKIESSVRFDI